MIYYNSNIINDWNFGDDDIIKVYRNGAVVFYKFDSEQGGYKVCYAVVADITEYQDTEFEDVYDKATEKWYKLNNLNQYEEYGVYGSGRTSCEGSTSRLPQGYTEVEYIENTSTAYIDTGAYIDTANFEIGYVIGNKQQLFGYCHQGCGSCTWLGVEQSATMWWGNFNNNTNISSYLTSGDNTIIFTPSGATINGTSISKTLSIGSDDIRNISLLIFARYDFKNNVVEHRTDSYMQVKSFYLKNNGTLVRDLVPAKRDSDNKYGMYDIVNDTFYLSPNDVDFIGGDPVTPTDCVTTYNGKLTVDDGYEYEWNGSSWVNLGEVSGSSKTSDFKIGDIDTPITSDASLITDGMYGIMLPVSLSANTSSAVALMGSSDSNTLSNLSSHTKTSVISENDIIDYAVWKFHGTATANTFYMENVATKKYFGYSNVSSSNSLPLVDESSKVPTVFSAFTKNNVTAFGICKGNTPNQYYAINDLYGNHNQYNWFNPLSSAGDLNNSYVIYKVKGSDAEYPKYYSEKSEPLDNLTFNTMAEAQAYAEANCVYDGMHATIDGDRYYFDSTDENGWVEDTSYTIWLDPSATNASFSIGHYWGENYKIVFTTYLSGSYSGDYGSFWQANGHTPIELSFYSNGFYYDMHNPTSTTAPNVRTTDYDFRILNQNTFSNYQNSQVMEITLTYGSFKAELADSGTLIYSSGSTKTGYSWYSGLYQANIGLNNANAKCHLSHIQIYNGNNELVNDFKFIKNNGVVGSQEISIYDSVTNTTYNNTNSNTPVYHIET